MLTELSKIYHRTGRSDLAIVMLSKANVMSPDCVERLCLMGEIGLTVQDPERARKYFEATLKIDKDNPKKLGADKAAAALKANAIVNTWVKFLTYTKENAEAITKAIDDRTI